MSCLLAQMLLARGNDGDDSGWMQLLILVIMAVFWALGGILKAKAGREQTDQGDVSADARFAPATGCINAL